MLVLKTKKPFVIIGTKELLRGTTLFALKSTTQQMAITILSIIGGLTGSAY